MNVRKAKPDDIDLLLSLTPNPDRAFFEQCFIRQCDIYIIEESGGVAAGYGVLNWQPKYAFYQKFDIPEIQDVNILPEFRQRGFATHLIQHIENIVGNENKKSIGISVGLNKEYGAAQRLYVKLGYIPDGTGVTYDRQYVDLNKRYPVDDDLCLMMVKSFKPE